MQRDSAALLDIVVFGQRAVRHLAGMDAARFAQDDLAQDAVVRCLGVVGEAAGRITPETRAAHPEVPWAAIVGMRNRLVHDYGALDVIEVFKTVSDDLPRLLARIEPLLPAGSR
jgi:uncharacterized protein with HEPN domain